MHDYLVIDIEAQGLATKYDPTVPIWMVGFYGQRNGEESSGVYTDLDVVADIVYDALEQGMRLVFHNASYDVPSLRLQGVDIPEGSYDDTLLLSYADLPGRESHSLKYWGQRLGCLKGDFHDFEGPPDGETREQWLERMALYCKDDCKLTGKLYEHLLPKVRSDKKLYAMYTDIDLPFIETIIECEGTGLYVDKANTERVYRQRERNQWRYKKFIDSLVYAVPGKEKRYKHKVKVSGVPTEFGYHKRHDVITYDHCALEPFNPASGKHREWVLRRFGWEPSEYNKDGSAKSGAYFLKKADIPIARAIIGVNDCAKVRKTFLEPMLFDTDEYSVLRGNFNPAVTLTGRLSSSKPNLQNIDSRLKKLFTSPGGWMKMVLGDLNAIESRILAYYLAKAVDNWLLFDLITSGEDMHTYNQKAWDLPTRKAAKAPMYGVSYGVGPDKLAKMMGVSKQKAEDVIQLFYDMYGIDKLKEKVWNAARRRKGRLYTRFGRRLAYPSLLSRNWSEKGRAERQSFNALLQGTGADIIKLMTNEAKPLINDMGGYIAAQVHDELVIYCPTDPAYTLAERLSETWKRDDLLVVGDRVMPVVADFEVNTYWKH